MNRRAAVAGLLLTALLLGVPAACLAQAAPAPQRVVTIEGITEYRLDNGLRILLYPDPSTPNVTVSVTVLVGSRMEGYGEAGMAHLLEHMLFKGTPSHPDIPRELKERGASYNATTSQDRTMYFERLPGTDANLEFALGLESDRLVHSLIRHEDLITEMTVVRNEFEMGENSPAAVLSQRLASAAYAWHNYGKAVIGNRSDIERVPIDRLQRFYRKYYRPDNALLCVGGRFEEPRVLELVARTFGKLPRPSSRMEETYTIEPPQDGEREVRLRRVGKLGLAGLLYHVPAASHEDFVPVRVLNEVLTDEPSGRLYEALVKTGRASAVSGRALPLHDPGYVTLYAQADPGALAGVQQTMIRVVEELPRQPITPKEVERVRTRMLKGLEHFMADSHTVTMQLGEFEAMGDWRLLFLYRDRLSKVTAADVMRVAGRYLIRSNRTAGLFIPTDHPERAAIPPAAPLADVLRNYRGGQAVAAGEAFEPTPANIEARVRRSQLPVGLKMALLPRKTHGSTVVLRLVLRYGNEQSLRGHTSATQFLGSLMSRGTRRHTYQQLQDELDRVGAQLDVGGMLGQVTVSLEVRRPDLPAALRLLGEILREPTFPADELRILKHETQDNLRRNQTEPTALAFREIQRLLNPYPAADVRYAPTIEESIARLEGVTRDEVAQLYTQLGAQAGELAIVGDFDPEPTARQLAGFLDGWRSSTPYARIPRPAHPEIPPNRREILTPDKANAVYAAAEWLTLGDLNPDYPALLVGNHLFGGATLSSRLGTRIRVKGGLSYGVGSQLATDVHDQASRFAVFAIANPTNLPRVEQLIRQELERLLREGATTAEVAESKRGLLEERKQARGDNRRLAQDLAEHLYERRTFAHDAEQEKRIAGLTAADVDAAFRRHLDPRRLLVVVAGDFHKKPEKR